MSQVVPPMSGSQPSDEPDLLRRAMLATALMGAAAWGADRLVPRTPLVQQLGTLDLARDIPTTLTGWQQDTAQNMQVVNPQQQAFVEQIYSQTLSRVYLNPQGARIMLSVAYSEDQRGSMALHLPDICYPAQGFEIRSRSQAEVPLQQGTQSVQRLEAVAGGQRYEPLSYWVVIGEHLVIGGGQRKLALLRYGLQGIIADGMIVRVSSIGQDTVQQYALQGTFIRDLLGALPDSLRRRVAGLRG